MACDSCSTGQEPVEDTSTPLTTALPQSDSDCEEFPTRSQSSSTLETLVSKQTFPISAPAVPFTPCTMFFYGSLMDTDILTRVARLTTPPSLSRGTVSSFRMRMWGPFPTLITSPSGKVPGMYWHCNNEAQFLRLKTYETDAYSWCFCDVETEDRKVLKGCRTFCWAGDPEDSDLEDGRFDLERYQRTTKGMYV